MIKKISLRSAWKNWFLASGLSRSLVFGTDTDRSAIYDFLLMFYDNFVLRHTVFEIFEFKNSVALKTGLGVCQGHWKCHHSIESMRLPIDVL